LIYICTHHRSDVKAKHVIHDIILYWKSISILNQLQFTFHDGDQHESRFT